MAPNDKPEDFRDLKIVLTPFIYPELTIPDGYLSRDMRAQACWYFYTLAQQQLEKVGKSTEDQFGIIDGNLWMDKRYQQTAKSVAVLYGLESPDEFAKAWDQVKAQADALGLPEPADEYTRLAPRLILGVH